MNLMRRVAKLEQVKALAKTARIAVRFLGPGAEHLQQPTEEQIRESMAVIDVQFVAAKEGRPA